MIRQMFDDAGHGEITAAMVQIPHIHAEYQGNKAVFAIESADLIQGTLPRKQLWLVQAWMELRRDELTADWQLAVNGEEPVKIAPLN